MKHQFKNKHNLHFPVNYLKNQPETTTMTKAAASPPISFLMDLNFPEYQSKIIDQLRMIVHLFVTTATKRFASGSLILSPFIKKMGAFFINLLSPIIMVFLKFESILIHHLTIIQEDFFKFMDSFVMMDVDVLQPAIVSQIAHDTPFSNDKKVSDSRKKIHRNMFSQAHLVSIKNIKQAIHKTKNNEAKKRSFTNASAKFINPARFTALYEKPKSKFVFIRKTDSLLKSLCRINIHNPFLKLPLKIIFMQIAAFGHRHYNRLFDVMDSVIITKHPQNQFVYEH